MKKTSGVATMVAVSVLALAAAAWACTVQPLVLGVTPMIATPGEQVKIEGSGVSSASPVELHWNSAAGPVIGHGTPEAGGLLSMTATVPDAAPGIYTLVLVTPGNGVGRAAVEVVAAESGMDSNAGPGKVNSFSADLWNGFTANRSASSQAAPASDSPAPSATGARALGIGFLGIGTISTLSVVAVLGARRRTRAGATD